MPRRGSPLLVLLIAATVAVGCGGGSSGAAAGPKATSPTTTAAAVVPTTVTTLGPSPLDGVETFQVVGAHSDAPQFYPQTPPVGGTHNPVWVPCGFYDKPVQTEMGVHSLEHGAIWITYRADLPQSEVDGLKALATSTKYILVSPWADGLPAPLVATAWGRQLRLQSVADPRLAPFIVLYLGHGPENAPC